MKEKSNICNIKANSWEDLISILNEAFADWPSYIFRGHSQSNWLLESTLSRALKKLNYLDKEELVINHLEKFKLRIRGRRGKNPRILSENELWALGQHYGLYTPLLDWSQSPYVGIFFALTEINNSPTGLRTLWALNSHDIDHVTEWYKTKGIGTLNQVELINPILDENDRLVNQSGLFTKAPLTTDIEDWILNGPEIEWVTLYKIDFPDSLRNEGIAFLDLMNINHSSLYPDLVGSSLDTNIKLEQTDYFEKRQNSQWEEFDKDNGE
jgi:hypothetical protein